MSRLRRQSRHLHPNAAARYAATVEELDKSLKDGDSGPRARESARPHREADDHAEAGTQQERR